MKWKIVMEKWRSERVFSLFLKISSYGIEQWLWMTKRWKEKITNVIFKIGYFQPMRRPHQGSSRGWNCAAAKVWAFTKVAKEGRSRHMVRVWVMSWHICVSTQIDLCLLIFSCYTIMCTFSEFKNKFVERKLKSALMCIAQCAVCTVQFERNWNCTNSTLCIGKGRPFLKCVVSIWALSERGGGM